MKRKSLKKVFVLTLFLFSLKMLFSQQNELLSDNQFYKISDVIFISEGKTNITVLKQNIEIDTDKVFSSEQELFDYIKIINQQLINLRLLDDIEIKTEKTEPNESFPVENKNITFYTITISFSDSKHLLILPKPGYDSNSGFELKVKMKDTNFLGLMNTFNLDFNTVYFNDYITDKTEFSLGLNFDYSLPFQIKKFQNTWDNEFSFKWTLGHSKPEYSYNTGLTFIYPFKKTSLKLELHEMFTRNEDYLVYGDSVYFTNKEKLSYIIPLTKINENKLTYTPAIEFTVNNDKDGININNTDLYGPLGKILHTLSLTNYNWIGNFRNGNSFSITNSYGWNFQSEKFIPAISLSAQYYKAFDFVSFTSSFYAVKYFNSSEKIGDKLRGTRDNQFYKNTSSYALNTNTAVVLNIDLPVHLFTTDWFAWGLKLFGPYRELSPAAQKIFYIPYRLFKIADFEMQVNPFIDIALTHNSITGKTFDLKDGYYNAGLEIFVYPLKWKSYVIRMSAGFDIGRILLKNEINMDWRDDIPPYEIFFGLGLHY